jgi:hypothetical protein
MSLRTAPAPRLRATALAALAAGIAVTSVAAWPAAAAKNPPPPKAGAWRTVKTSGSDAKGTFRVAAGRHKVTKLTVHGGDVECSNTKATVKGSPLLRIVDGASGTAGQPEWVVGKKVGGATTGLNPEQTHVKVAGKTYRASIAMQFPSPSGLGSGYVIFDNTRLGSVCTLNFSFKKK